MRCTKCGNDNREGRKFCAQCGQALKLACPSCGAPNELGERFCGDCGAALVLQAQASAGQSPTAAFGLLWGNANLGRGRCSQRRPQRLALVIRTFSSICMTEPEEESQEREAIVWLIFSVSVGNAAVATGYN